MQVVIADVDANGRALPTSTSFALSGQVRAQGEGDDSLNRLATKAGCKLEVCCAPGDEIGINGAYPHFFFSTAQRLELPKVNRTFFLRSV